MFCPKCRTEYQKGIGICADCGTPLVEILDPEPEAEYVEYDEVLAIFSAGEIALMKSLLNDAQITYYFKGEMFNYVDPLIQPARLMVRRDQVADALEIIKGMEFHYMLFSPDRPKEEESP